MPTLNARRLNRTAVMRGQTGSLMQLKRLDHRFAQRRMSEYVDGALTPRRRRQIERHAAECPECGPLRRDLIRLVRELRELRTGSAPRQSAATIVIERIRQRDALAGRPSANC